MQAFLEVHQQTPEPFLEEIARRCGFTVREDVIICDEFEGTKIYFLEGPEKRYGELKKSLSQQDACVLSKVSEPFQADYSRFLADTI